MTLNQTNEVAALKAELATHGKTCDCAHKIMCEDREVWLLSQIEPDKYTSPRKPVPNQIQRIESELNDAHIPKEVWIGTDSTADRVTWLITRNKLNQQNSRSRFAAMNALADALEVAINTVECDSLDKDGNELPWYRGAKTALVLAGRRQGKHQ